MTLITRFINAFIMFLGSFLFLTTTYIYSKKITNEPFYIDPALQGLFNEFKADAKKHKVTPNFNGLTTSFTTIKDALTLGYCVPKFNIVKIDKQKFDALDNVGKKLLLYHEWAHCTLKRDHTPYKNTLCPRSVMNPYLTPVQKCYEYFKEWYDKELFTNPDKTKLIGEEDYEDFDSDDVIKL